MKTKTLIIVNPISGVGRQRRIETLLKQNLNQDLFDYTVRYTEHIHHGTEIAREAADKRLRSHVEYIYDIEAFRTYCRELAAHFKGRIDHYEMWNEPYWQTFFKGTGPHFMDVFHAGAKGIREGNQGMEQLVSSFLSTSELLRKVTEGEKVKEILATPASGLDAVFQKVGRPATTTNGNFRLNLCYSQDHEFAALHLQQFSGFEYHSVSEIRFAAGEEAKKLLGAFVK